MPALRNSHLIISECTDAALSRLLFVNKIEFYLLLERSYGVKPEEIGVNFETFHESLRNCFGVKHYEIERLILKILRERTKMDSTHTPLR